MNRTHHDQHTNYKLWSFVLLIMQFLIYALVIFLAFRYASNYDNSVENFKLILNTLYVMRVLMLFAGVIFIILGMIHKERRNYQWYISVVVYSLIIFYYIISFIS